MVPRQKLLKPVMRSPVRIQPRGAEDHRQQTDGCRDRPIGHELMRHRLWSALTIHGQRSPKTAQNSARSALCGGFCYAECRRHPSRKPVATRNVTTEGLRAEGPASMGGRFSLAATSLDSRPWTFDRMAVECQPPNALSAIEDGEIPENLADCADGADSACGGGTLRLEPERRRPSGPEGSRRRQEGFRFTKRSCHPSEPSSPETSRFRGTGTDSSLAGRQRGGGNVRPAIQEPPCI